VSIENGNARPTVDCSVEPSRTKQSFKESCDINVIMARQRKTGLITHLSTRHPVYADVSQMTDFRQSLEQVREVEDFFMRLPARVREHFANEPASFLEYMNDSGRTVDELKELGLRLLDDDRFNDPEPPAAAPAAVAAAVTPPAAALGAAAAPSS